LPLPSCALEHLAGQQSGDVDRRPVERLIGPDRGVRVVANRRQTLRVSVTDQRPLWGLDEGVGHRPYPASKAFVAGGARSTRPVFSI
jgi:hypothetical protein